MGAFDRDVFERDGLLFHLLASVELELNDRLGEGCEVLELALLI